MQLMISVTTKALKDSGWAEKDPDVGVFTAANTSDFVLPMPTYMIARVVAGQLKTNGSHTNVQQADASGYLAVSLALDEINNQAVQTAVCAGVTLMLKPLDMYAGLSLSPSGTMRPLDTAADGTVLGEGCAAVVLKPGPHDDELCTIEGWATTVTSAMLCQGAADAARIQRAAESAIERGSVTPGSIGFAHVHATGNNDFDWPEVEAISAATGGGRAIDGASAPLVLAGHKANYGHTQSATGLVALVASVLAMQHRSIPKHLNVAHPADIVTEHSLLLPTDAAHQFEYEGYLLGCINGTSVSGDNVHLVLKHSPLRVIRQPRPIIVHKHLHTKTSKTCICFTASCQSAW